MPYNEHWKRNLPTRQELIQQRRAQAGTTTTGSEKPSGEAQGGSNNG
ncbi:hypothetical protein NE236_13965 [Actinoallomurus purpureus]|nr:hypothetical protein [Actinoallomurus purpureus]MCO6006095.1 hypothetical protein [Actinoallomurus purpureus]